MTSCRKPESQVTEADGLTLFEAAVRLSVAERTVRRACKASELPHYHVGRRGDFRVYQPPTSSTGLRDWGAWQASHKAAGWKCSHANCAEDRPRVSPRRGVKVPRKHERVEGGATSA